MTRTNCRLCGDENAEIESAGGDGWTIKCTICRNYGFSDTDRVVVFENRKKNYPNVSERYLFAVLSWMSRQSAHKPFMITHDVATKINSGEIKLPDPFARRMNFIRYVGDNTQQDDTEISRVSWRVVAPIIGALNEDDVNSIFKDCSDEGWVTSLYGADATPRPSIVLGLSLSLSGWQKYHALLKKTDDGMTAVIAMKFGDRELDSLVNHHIKPIVQEQTKYKISRVSDDPQAGLIDNRMIMMLRDAPFIIADLTHGNHGAYWEAGFAEGLGKPVIYICREPEPGAVPLHFDTNHRQTAFWPKNPCDSANRAALDKFLYELVATIRNSMASRGGG